ncbi:MAG TPA: cytochrome P450 [Polyangiaceae bacterium]|nr:cytochrome P450 [Polyangiaceae bacterium]
MTEIARQGRNFDVAGVPLKAEANAANPELASCPFDPNRDERKSARLAARHVKPEPGVEVIGNFGFAREILRSPNVKQDGAGAEHIDVGNPEHMPVFYLDGEPHHTRRAAIVKFFTPRAIQGRYIGVMQRTTDQLLARLRASGTARLDEISFELAVSVASEIVGLTESDGGRMARRLATFLRSTFSNAKGLERRVNKLKEIWYGSQFYVIDVLPAVRSRRKQRREDIISQTLDKGYSNRAIMIECMTYATAGMVTTREFIVMVAWHLFDRPALREQFLAADEEGQFAILQEILRLEPIAAMIYRRAGEDIETTSRGAVRAGSKFAIDMRAVNSDESAVGACPYALDPDRARRLNQNGTFMSFGDGSHRCPGWQVALNETRVFIDRLLRVPGIRLERAPDMLWNAPLMSYELRNAIIACDRG